jgi:hypothetical protein
MLLHRSVPLVVFALLTTLALALNFFRAANGRPALSVSGTVA